MTAAVLVAGAPPGQAAPVPWDWTIVTAPFTADANSYATGTAQCPADSVPITGGVAPNGSLGNAYQIEKVNEYAQDGLVSGGRWHVTIYNRNTGPVSLKVVLHCIPAAQLPATTYVSTVLSITEAGNYAEGFVSCPANTVAVAGGVDWDNFSSRLINFSGATYGGDGWYAIGRNSDTTAHLYVEAYCLDINDIPGLKVAQTEYHKTGNVYDVGSTVVSCPGGTRVLSGGTEVHFWGSSNSPGHAFASWPTFDSWHVTSYDNTLEYVYVRAQCVPAGLPTISIDEASPGPEGTQTQARSALFRLSGSDPAGSAVTFHCALDSAALAVCPTTRSYSSLDDGAHTFTAFSQAQDDRTSSIATYSWSIDTTAPTVSLKALRRVTLGSSAHPSWTGSDAVSGVQSYGVRYRTASYTTGLGDWQEPATWAQLTSTSVSWPLAFGDTVCFSVRAIDNVGNQSDWSPQHCTTRPLDDRALIRATSGWTQATGTAFWRKTATRATKHRERLTLAGATLDRVGLVATRCGTCGVVAVYVGSVKIGTIDLHRSKTQNRAVLLLPAVTPVTGTVRIKVVSRAKRVTVDGLVVAKSA